MKKNLRIFAKNKRSEITLDFVSKANLAKQIKYCLDDIFFYNHNIKTACLYYPINNEIEPFEFVKHFEERHIVMSLPVVDMAKKSMLFKKWSPEDKRAHLRRKLEGVEETGWANTLPTLASQEEE